MTYVMLAFSFFVLVGAKVLLGFLVVYLLMPRDTACAGCDAEMIPIEAPNGRRRLYRLLRLQPRWCIECGERSLGRAHPPLPARALQLPLAASRWSQ